MDKEKTQDIENEENMAEKILEVEEKLGSDMGALYRRTTVLKLHKQGKSNTEIAGILGIPEDMVTGDLSIMKEQEDRISAEVNKTKKKRQLEMKKKNIFKVVKLYASGKEKQEIAREEGYFNEAEVETIIDYLLQQGKIGEKLRKAHDKSREKSEMDEER